jgi:alpha-methylacyl-CoA racemase
MRPLDGIFVLDFSALLPGPMATLLLAEAGAEVIKVERPGGEEMRSYTPRWGNSSVNFALLNRGKKSVALDLKDQSDRARLRPLVERADIIVEQFRPGVMARLGLDYQTVSKSNSSVIYCAITGYGQIGPKRDVVGHDLNYIGDAGLLSLSMGDGVIPPALIADIGGGAYPAVINILLALQERQRTGHGCYLDIAMSDNVFPFMYWALGNGLAAGAWPKNSAELVTGGTPRYRVYATSDGRFVAAAPLEEKFWRNFCEATGLDPDLRDDSRNVQATTQRITEIIRSRDAETWSSVFSSRECCCSIVATLEEAIADPQFRARGLFRYSIENENGQTLPALPVPIDPGFRRSSEEILKAPQLGESNSQLRVAAGN